MFPVEFAEKSDKNSTPGENQIKNTDPELDIKIPVTVHSKSL